jgi:4,5-dihydroxyphthalate decarboxylase
MARLELSVAVGDYDRTRALFDGTVTIDGVDPVFMALGPEEIFFRAFRASEFDICELSLSSYTLKTAQGDSPYIAVPAFVSRAFRHTAIYVRTDRIKKPVDLKGKKVGVPEYQLTANVWARALLTDDYGVKPADIHWIRGGIEEPGRPEKLAVNLPAGVRLDNAPEGETISGLLETGEIDGFIAPRPPRLIERGHPHIGWLFPDPTAVAKDYFKRTGYFPIMRASPVAPGRRVQGFRAGEGTRRRAALRHVIDQSDAAVRGRDAARSARADGRGLLVLRRRGKPQGARLFPWAASRAGAFAAAC